MTADEPSVVSSATLRSLSRSVLHILRTLGGAPVQPSPDVRLEALIDNADADRLRLLLEVSLPALALEGHDELAESVGKALRSTTPTI